jgi:hypothetical protein
MHWNPAEPGVRKWSPTTRWGAVVLMMMALAGLTFVPGVPEPWQTRQSVDLNSGDDKVEQLVFGFVVHTRTHDGEFSRQLRQYVHPVPTTPRWWPYSWHDHFRRGWGDGIFIGRRCDDVVEWMDLNEVDTMTRTAVLKRPAAELAAMDEDAVGRELDAMRHCTRPR